MKCILVKSGKDTKMWWVINMLKSRPVTHRNLVSRKSGIAEISWISKTSGKSWSWCRMTLCRLGTDCLGSNSAAKDLTVPAPVNMACQGILEAMKSGHTVSCISSRLRKTNFLLSFEIHWSTIDGFGPPKELLTNLSEYSKRPPRWSMGRRMYGERLQDLSLLTLEKRVERI